MFIPDTSQPQSSMNPPASVSSILRAPAEFYSVLATVAIAVGLAILASISSKQVSNAPTSTWVLWLAFSVGGLGGLAHEFVQSGGQILFVARKEDGIYLGSIAGVVLGAVAGILAVRGLAADPSTLKSGVLSLIFEVFMAGLALKGVAEAAGGQPVQPRSDSSTMGAGVAARGLPAVPQTLPKL